MAPYADTCADMNQRLILGFPFRYRSGYWLIAPQMVILTKEAAICPKPQATLGYMIASSFKRRGRKAGKQAGRQAGKKGEFP